MLRLNFSKASRMMLFFQRNSTVLELNKPVKQKNLTSSSDYGNSEGENTLRNHKLDIDTFN